MKNYAFILAFLLVASVSFAQKSPRKQSDGKIGDVTVNIDYGAPSVKGRKVWGGLEKYGKVWRAGANENTTISFDKDVTINGKPLAAGKYGFFIIPKEKEAWTIIFNKKNSNWGAFKYKQKEDAFRLDITPNFVDENQEQLLYAISANSIDIAWEKMRISIPIN